MANTEKIKKDLQAKRWARFVQMNGYALRICGEVFRFTPQVIDHVAERKICTW